MCRMPKYSLLLPVHNGIKYIKNCVESIINCGYDDYELVISENCSDDGTKEYVDGLAKKDRHVKVFHTNALLPLHCNWSNAINHSSGEWAMIIGADDAVTPSFFSVADKLVDIAEKKKVKIVKANRIYYFWDDVNTRKVYKNCLCSFSIRNRITLKKTRDVFFNGLYNSGFCDMPQMYSTCLFKMELIFLMKSIVKNDMFFLTCSPDGFLGTFACCLEDKILWSDFPLGWVGTSSSSTGIKDGDAVKNNIVKLSAEQYRDFADETYKTINSTEFLILRAYQEIQKLHSPFVKKYSIDYLMVYNIVAKRLFADSLRKPYLDDFLQAFPDALNFSSSKKVVALPLVTKIVNKLRAIVNRLICNIEQKSFEFSYDSSDMKTFHDVNEFIFGNEDVQNILRLL